VIGRKKGERGRGPSKGKRGSRRPRSSKRTRKGGLLGSYSDSPGKEFRQNNGGGPARASWQCSWV